ncbi:Uncharacterised protein [Enterobacter cloacae]|nr:Uncharacterised protein [Enterobacter cloacae]
MAILFQHGKHRLRVFRTHDQQAVDALLRHHRQVSALFFNVVPRVAQNQGIAFLKAVFFNGFDDFSKVSRFTAGGQQANRFGVINLQATGDRTWRVVQFFDCRPNGITRLFCDETRFVNNM